MDNKKLALDQMYNEIKALKEAAGPEGTIEKSIKNLENNVENVLSTGWDSKNSAIVRDKIAAKKNELNHLRALLIEADSKIAQFKNEVEQVNAQQLTE